jgi:predicted nucleic acid-binding protein
VFSIIKNSGGKYSFTDFPEICYIDTSFINELHGYPEDKYLPLVCQDFIKEALKHKTILLTSGAVSGELYHLIRMKYIRHKTKNPKMNINMVEDYIDKNPSVNKIIIQEIDKAMQSIKQFFTYGEYIHNQTFDKMILKVMGSYGLNSTDAKHVIVSLSNYSNSIATIDSDYIKTDNFNIYTPTKTAIRNSIGRPNIYLPYNDTYIDSFK